MRVAVHVHPGSKRAGVGGEHGGALVVRVAERAVDGKATVPARQVSLVRGATSRSKLLDVDGADPARLTELLAGG